MSKNWQRPTRRDALLGDRVGSYAIARHVRMSPQKVRRVVDLVRGMSVTDALDTLRFAPQAASEPVYKVIASAAANAEQTESLRSNELYVSQIFVDEGTTMRRIRPRAKGSASRILKRSSHITAVVEPESNRGPIPPSAQVVTRRFIDLEIEEQLKAEEEAKAAKAAKKAEKAEKPKAEKAEKVKAVKTEEPEVEEAEEPEVPEVEEEAVEAPDDSESEKKEA